MNFKDVKEYEHKKIALNQDGYYLYRPMKSAEGIVYWMRMGIFPSSQITQISKQKGYKMWSMMTDEEKSSVNTFPDINSTCNVEHMSKIKRQSREEAQREMESKMSGKTNIVVNVDDSLIEAAATKKRSKKDAD